MDHQNISVHSGYRIEVCKEYDFLSNEYSTLFESAAATAFQSPLWLHEFYKTLVPGCGAEPIIMKIYREGQEQPEVILPLVRETYFGIQIIQPADLGVADYNAVIGSPKSLEDVCAVPGLASKILTAMKPYHILLFRKQPPSTFDASKLFSKARKTPNISSSYEVEIEQTHDHWLKTHVSKNMRKGLRRKLSGFQKDHGPLEYSELSNEADIVNAFEIMRDLRAGRYETDLFSRPEYFAFYRNLAVKGAQTGMTSTFVGKLENRIMSIDFGVRHKGRFLFLLAAFVDDEDMKRYSLGLLGLNEKIRHEADLGTTIFDFTIGDEPYKLSFGAEQIPLTNVTVTAGPIGQLAFTAYQSRGPFRRTLKKLMPKFS
jgi:CelD/BcsL family acetyltransferase involved in cellulose biosynthesis